jgi:hypothetical protein
VPESVTQEIGESKVLIGDDIVDNWMDLKGVMWRLKNSSAQDALWDFRESFEIHWGQHLWELQLYLHVMAWGTEGPPDPSTSG